MVTHILFVRVVKRDLDGVMKSDFVVDAFCVILIGI